MIAQFRFQVTEEHIASSRQGDMNRCAVADALVARGYNRVSVGNSFIAFDRGDERWKCSELPTDLSFFIASFDKDRANVSPTTFTFDAKKVGE